MKYAYTVKGTTVTVKPKAEVEDELREACEAATDDGQFEVESIVVAECDE